LKRHLRRAHPDAMAGLEEEEKKQSKQQPLKKTASVCKGKDIMIYSNFFEQFYFLIILI
jgi:hypothetical protein